MAAVGSLVAASGLLLSSLVPEIHFLYVFFGIFVGKICVYKSLKCDFMIKKVTEYRTKENVCDHRGPNPCRRGKTFHH